MTNPRIYRSLAVGLATTVAVASMGCGMLDQAKQLVDNAQVLGDFADRLGTAQNLTFTAEYTLEGGDKVTIVQEPPHTAFIADDARFIFAADATYLCVTEEGVLTCQKSPNDTSTMSPAEDDLAAGVGGPGFVTPELALAVILAASLVPGAKVELSEKTIAGQSSKCASATGLEAAAQEGDTDVPKDFTVCITDKGILASFSATSTTEELKAIELTTYSDTADPSAFMPPAGAKIVDVTEIQPT